MRRFGLLGQMSILLVLVVGLLLPGGLAPTPAAAATPCPTGPITIEDLIRLAADRGPLLDRYPPAVAGIYERAQACLGARTLRFKAYVTDPGGVGGTSAYGVSPRWMLDAGVFLFGTSRRVDGLVDGGFVMAAVPPRLGNVQARFESRWVLVTARFGDAVASSCRATGPTGATPSPAEVVAICRSVLVVSSIEPLAAPSTTTAAVPGRGEVPPAARALCQSGSNVTLDDLLYTMGDYAGPLTLKYGIDPMLVSDAALECYGNRTLRFTAWVRDPGVIGWVYPFGLKPAWFWSVDSLFVSVAAEPPPGVTPLVALAVPPELGDLQAKHVGSWVRVTGHFDDPAAQACVPTGEPGVGPTPAEAVAICRSTFVVSSVARATAPATTTADAAAPSSGIEPWRVVAWLMLAVALGAVLAIWLAERLRRV